VRLTRHAEERMAERGITRAEVEAVYNDPDTTYPGKEGTECRVKTIAGRRIKIVVIWPDLVKTVVVQS
jgi:hypothetical protein